MTSTSSQRKDALLLGLMSFAIFCPTVVFTVVGNAPQTAFLVMVGLLVSALWRAPLARTTRSYVYTTLAALVTTVGQHQFLPAHGEQFFLMPGEIYCPMLLYLAVVLTFFEARESIVASVVALSVLATLIAGNVVAFQTRTPAFLHAVEDMEEFHRFYGIAVICQMLAILALLTRAIRYRAQDPLAGRGKLLRAWVFAACLACAATLAMAMRSGALQFQRRFQDAMASFLQRYARQRRRGVVFGREVDLWRTARVRSQKDQTIVLRVRSRRAPGYLRGYAYQHYINGQWRSSDAGNLLRALPKNNGHITMNVFRRLPPPPEDEAERMDILPATGFRSQVLVAPGDTSQIEIIASDLRNSDDGELGVGNWEYSTGYVAVVPKTPGEPAYPEPKAATLDAATYLNVPDYLRSSLEPVAKDIFADLPPDAPFAVQCATIVSYFRTNFRYKLGVQMEMYAGDPVVQFLTHWKRGHCELFAASTALLLRLRGIPTRYVTGFVCMEQPPGTHHYISRMEDAHAWVEAYNKDKDRWELVEATPPAGVPHGRVSTSLVWSLFDSLRMAWQRMLALMKRGYVAQALAAFLTGIFAALVALVATPTRAAVTLFLLAALFFWALRRARRRMQAQIEEQGAGRWLLRRARKRLLQEFGRAGLEISPGDTLRHLLARLTSGDKRETAAVLAPAIGEYERLRYGPEQPSAQDVKAFETRLRQAFVKR